jgi:tRNA pseudouridine38-40 synthase
MRRILIGIQYKGTAYCGWQRQTNGLSVQAVLMRAWRTLVGEDVTFHGSGRTDAGVHAMEQCAHFDTEARIPVDKIPYAFNTRLPEDVRVMWAREVPASFHARFDVKRKTYVYKLYWGEHADAFLYQTHCYVGRRPDLAKMIEASKVMLGEHDFKAMQATGGFVKDTHRTIYSIDIAEQGNVITVTVCGNGFLYNMVRILVGTLVYAGWDRLTADAIRAAIESRDRTGLGITLDACGLYLAKVEYDL